MRREVRRDPLTGREVVLSEARPLAGPTADVADRSTGQCPFCPGFEDHTAPTIDAVAGPSGWRARAFANRLPALVVEGSLRHEQRGPLERTSGIGAHEVLVECPEHAPLHGLPLERMVAALELARARLSDLEGDQRMAYLGWFRNHGVAAGASQLHPHAQIMGVPVVPPLARDVFANQRLWWGEHGRSLLRDIVDFERERGARVLWEGQAVIALAAWAPWVPFEVWLLPASGDGCLRHSTDGLLEEVASAMWRVLRALDAVLGSPAYNAVLYDPPPRTAHAGLGFHFRLLPRLAVPGGAELGWGLGLHPMVPRDAAALTRAALE